MQARVSIGDGGNLALPDRIRRHGNFAEHVPLALILLGILELDLRAAGAFATFAVTLVGAALALSSSLRALL